MIIHSGSAFGGWKDDELLVRQRAGRWLRKLSRHGWLEPKSLAINKWKKVCELFLLKFYSEIPAAHVVKGKIVFEMNKRTIFGRF